MGKVGRPGHESLRQWRLVASEQRMMRHVVSVDGPLVRCLMGYLQGDWCWEHGC